MASAYTSRGNSLPYSCNSSMPVPSTGLRESCVRWTNAPRPFRCGRTTCRCRVAPSIRSRASRGRLRPLSVFAHVAIDRGDRLARAQVHRARRPDQQIEVRGTLWISTARRNCRTICRLRCGAIEPFRALARRRSAVERCGFAQIDFVARRKLRVDDDLVGQQARPWQRDRPANGRRTVRPRACRGRLGCVIRDMVSGEPASNRPRGSPASTRRTTRGHMQVSGTPDDCVRSTGHPCFVHT